jgi:iron complex transport system substrate-binding protein
MKTKNKLLAVVGIAIVLCSLLLVAIPAIAAEQTTQKASASEVTTTSEDDFVLGVYGNANEDDTIDMRDLTYVKLIFFGKKPETELADAKYDGKINPLDFIQIKLIIVGKEKEITFEDIYGEAVTVNKPVKRVIVSYRDMVEVLRALNAENEIVGIAEHIQVEKVYFPDISRLPTFGSFWMPDFEAVLNLNTEVFLTFGDAMTLEKKEDFKDFRRYEAASIYGDSQELHTRLGRQ